MQLSSSYSNIAAQEVFQNEQGEPLVPEIAAAVGISREAVRFILDGTLPRAPVKAGKKKDEGILS